MKKLILGVLVLVALASCNTQEGDEVLAVHKYNDSSYSYSIGHYTVDSKQKHSVGDIIAIVPATDPTQLKLPMRDAETRQCLNCDTVVITNTVCIGCDHPGTSDTTIHYYKSKYP